MAVRTRTRVEPHANGFRAYVTVSDDTGGSTEVDVSIAWEVAKAHHVGPDTGAPPTLLSTALGLAVWQDQTVSAGTPFGVVLDCNEGVTATVTVTGSAVSTADPGDGDRSSASWSCAFGEPA